MVVGVIGFHSDCLGRWSKLGGLKSISVQRIDQIGVNLLEWERGKYESGSCFYLEKIKRE